MPQITSIKQQKNKNRVNVYLDNKFGFGIDLDNFVILNLKVGQDYSEEEITNIIKKAEFQKVLDKLIKFSMIRPRSEKEVRDYLFRKKVPEVIWSDLFSQLKNFELLDDKKFTRWWVEQRQEFSPKSKRVLTNELQLKGIDKELIKKTLSESPINEEVNALVHLKKRSTHWLGIETAKRKQKMLEYLLRKGFDYETAQRAVKAYLA